MIKPVIDLDLAEPRACNHHYLNIYTRVRNHMCVVFVYNLVATIE